MQQIDVCHSPLLATYVNVHVKYLLKRKVNDIKHPYFRVRATLVHHNTEQVRLTCSNGLTCCCVRQDGTRFDIKCAFNYSDNLVIINQVTPVTIQNKNHLEIRQIRTQIKLVI